MPRWTLKQLGAGQLSDGNALPGTKRSCEGASRPNHARTALGTGDRAADRADPVSHKPALVMELLLGALFPSNSFALSSSLCA